MSKELTVFLDSDVLLSSVISQKGAAYQLTLQAGLIRCISNYSALESKRVALGLKLPDKDLSGQINKCQIVDLRTSPKEIKKKYLKYVHDEDDTHIVAGAVESSARFLVTYNLKDYLSELVLKDLKIIILTPGIFLQYLRSRG